MTVFVAHSMLTVALLLGAGLVCGCNGASGGDDARLRGIHPPGHASAAAAGSADRRPVLQGPPLSFAPTATGFGLSVALGSGKPGQLRMRVRAEGHNAWRPALPASSTPAPDLARWQVRGLEPGTRYEYEVLSKGESLYRGRVVTQRPKGEAFRFVLLTDPHIPPRQVDPSEERLEGFAERTLRAVASDAAAFEPDFMINLGDVLGFHALGFNAPPPDTRHAGMGYLNYRRLLGDALGHTSHFLVIGNWDGESGHHTPNELARSRAARLLYAPGPSPETYAEGGSEHQDYYAFTWGDALFVVLNVMSYTPTAHLLEADPGLPDDWTLGDEQLAWFRKALEGARSKWRFVLIHHAVGGAAGDSPNSAYGRGGGRAARVGEQAIVHELMLSHGVQIFFYGHDHVFTDMVVDGIHYTLPGSAGAPWKFTAADTGYREYWPDSGHARVHVSPEAVRVQFVALGGRVIHQFGLPRKPEPRCHPGRDPCE